MHRVKRTSTEAKSFGFSPVHRRTTHDLPGDEPKTKTKREKSGTNFQLNAIGGPLGEEFEDKT
jgi:hypothetical protein